MNKDGTINFEKLEKQLLVAVEEDAKYKRENDAKFRAVAQRVGSYEEFKDIVAASHLKPLEKKDKEGDYYEIKFLLFQHFCDKISLI